MDNLKLKPLVVLSTLKRFLMHGSKKSNIPSYFNISKNPCIFVTVNQSSMKKLLPLFLFVLYSSTALFSQQPTRIPHLEIPAITGKDAIVKHLGYTLSYNEKNEQANWVAYELTAAETRKTVKRTNHFRPDEAVKTGSATNADYEGSGYDRGHMAPAADMSWCEQAMEESFLYSNMSPQDKGFNRGIWKKLEEQVRRWAVENKDIYIVTGPVLNGVLSTIGPDRVSVPCYYYKVILDYTLPDLKGIGFIMPNASSTQPLQSFAVSIDSVEKVTGINFFPALPDQQEQAIEKTLCIGCWSWNTSPPPPLQMERGVRKNASTTPIQMEKGVIHSLTTSSTNPLSSRRGVGVEVIQCSAITKSGIRCKRMTSNATRLGLSSRLAMIPCC